jgi:hypothetical protein
MAVAKPKAPVNLSATRFASSRSGYGPDIDAIEAVDLAHPGLHLRRRKLRLHVCEESLRVVEVLERSQLHGKSAGGLPADRRDLGRFGRLRRRRSNDRGKGGRRHHGAGRARNDGFHDDFATALGGHADAVRGGIRQVDDSVV